MTGKWFWYFVLVTAFVLVAAWYAYQSLPVKWALIACVVAGHFSGLIAFGLLRSKPEEKKKP